MYDYVIYRIRNGKLRSVIVDSISGLTPFDALERATKYKPAVFGRSWANADDLYFVLEIDTKREGGLFKVTELPPAPPPEPFLVQPVTGI